MIKCAKPTATNPRGSYDEHEEKSKYRYSAMQDSLTKYAEARDEVGLRVLAAQLDAQLKLEDYLIRSQEAEHAKVKVWGPMYGAVVPAVVSLIVALVTSLLAHHKLVTSVKQ